MTRKTWTVLAVFLTFAVSAFAAELKIAVIDMRKVFQDYAKTKVMEKKLQEQSDMFRDYSMRLSSQIQTMRKQFETARNEAQDNIALSEAERKNREIKARELYEQIMVRQTELKNYNQSRGDQIRATYEKMRSDILQEIKAVVQNRAVLGGYHLVLDRSGSTSNEISAVVYYLSSMDITQVVLDDLNRAYKPPQDTTPAAVTPAAAAPKKK